jgi:hypothetical protein
MTNLVDLLDLGPGHDHHVTMLHRDLENLLVTQSALLETSRKKELRVALGPETHRGGRAERKGSNDRAQLALAVIMILCWLDVSKATENAINHSR